MLKFVKKAFTFSVVSTTILWSSMVSAFIPSLVQAAACPALNAGDMIKVVGKSAIYVVNNDLKVLYFPNGDVFKSWRPTYGGYVSVSQDCYDTLSVPSAYPGAANYRAGSYIVKRPSSDQLYVVEPGNKLAKITVSAAQGLYGAGYRVMTVDDAFWPHYVNRGADVTTNQPHEGMLVSNDGKNWYVDAGSVLREVTATGLTANGFQTKFVHSVTADMISGFTTGAVISAEVKAVTDKTQSGGVVVATPATPATPSTPSASSTQAVSAGNVTVSLAADNPAGGYLASGSAFNKVLKLGLSAGSGAVKVTSLKLHKLGYYANANVTGVDVIDSAGKRHGNVVTSLSADNDVLLTMSSDPIVVTAGTPNSATVRVNLTSGNNTGVLQLSLVGATSVGSNGAVDGAFPITGNQFNVQNGASSIASVTVTGQLVNSNATLNPDASNEQDLSKFQIANSSSNEAVHLTSLTVYNNGTAADGDVLDVQLVNQDGTVLATAQMSNKNVVFDLSAKPLFLDKGITKTLTVRAKLVNGAARTLQYVVYNDYDVVVVGSSSGASVLPTTNDATGNATAASFPAGNATNFNKVTIGSGTLSMNKDSGSPTSAVVPGATSVVLAKYYVTPTGEDQELRKIAVSVATAGTYTLAGTLYVKVDGAVVYSVDATTVATGTTPTQVSLSSYPTLKAGKTSYVTVEANINNNATSASTYQVYFDTREVKRVITNDIVDPGTANASANIISVSAASLTVTTLSAPVAQSVVAGTNNFVFAKYELNAGSSGEDVKVSSMIVSSTMTGTGAALTDITNLVMYDENGNPLTTTNSTVTNGATVTFNFTTPLLVTRSTPRVLTLKADVVARSVTSGAETFRYAITSATTNVITATGKDTGNTVGTGAQTINSGGQIMTVAASGSMTLSLVSGSNASPSLDQLVNVGTQNAYVYAFKMTTLNEAQKVTTLKLSASSSAMSSNDVSNLRLYRNNETSPFATGNQMTCASNLCTFTWTATDNVLPDAVMPGSPVTIYVKADIGGVGQAKLGEAFRFFIASSTTDVVTKGAYTGQAGSVSGVPQSGGVTYLVPFNVLVTGDAPASGSSQTQAVLAGTQLARLKVTNNGSAQVTLTNLQVTNSGSHTSSSTTIKLLYSDQNSTNYTQNSASSSVATTGTSGETTNFTVNGATGVTIDGGAYRYFTVAIDAIGGSVTGDSYQFSVASLGNVKYSVSETNLGYEGDADNNALADTITGLYADGKPTLGTFIKQ